MVIEHTSGPNPAHALDGGIPSLFHIERYRSAASDVRRYRTVWVLDPNPPASYSSGCFLSPVNWPKVRRTNSGLFLR
jgi:hypothetical protein